MDVRQGETYLKQASPETIVMSRHLITLQWDQEREREVLFRLSQPPLTTGPGSVLFPNCPPHLHDNTNPNHGEERLALWRSGSHVGSCVSLL